MFRVCPSRLDLLHIGRNISASLVLVSKWTLSSGCTPSSTSPSESTPPHTFPSECTSLLFSSECTSLLFSSECTSLLPAHLSVHHLIHAHWEKTPLLPASLEYTPLLPASLSAHPSYLPLWVHTRHTFPLTVHPSNLPLRVHILPLCPLSVHAVLSYLPPECTTRPTCPSELRPGMAMTELLRLANLVLISSILRTRLLRFWARCWRLWWSWNQTTLVSDDSWHWLTPLSHSKWLTAQTHTLTCLPDS